MKKELKLSLVFRRRLLKVTAIIVVISVVLVAIAIPLIMRRFVSNLLLSQINELKEEVDYESHMYFSSLEYYFAMPSMGTLEEDLEFMHVSGWTVIDSKGVVEDSSDKSKIKTKAADDPELTRDLENLQSCEKDQCYVYDITDEAYASGKWAKRVVCDFEEGKKIVLSYDADSYYYHMDIATEKACNFNTVGSEGYNLLLNQSGKVISPSAHFREKKGIGVSDINIKTMTSLSNEDSLFTFQLNGTEYYAMYLRAEGYYAVSVITKSEILTSVYFITAIIGFLVTVLMVIIFLRVNHLTKRLIVDNIGKINDELSEITDGNLDVKIDVEDNLEFTQLSEGINTTVSTLKGYIARESERLNSELELAHSIQTSSLPNVFPPYPDRHDIDVFASMKPAKDVGGDFYDFFFTDSNHFVFLVADVSDKGIPAALFMMKAKTIIKSLSQANRSVDEIICIANNALCEDNEADMFVTLWFGVLDTDTGKVAYVNAGHCKPLVRRAGEGFEYLNDRPDFVVAGEESVPYHRRELTLNNGDALFLYTDGVTEAVNTADELYGEDRLRRVLAAQPTGTAREICESVHADIRSYSDGATQTDDITMLAVVFNGARSYKEISVEATVDNLRVINGFLEEQMEASGFDFTPITQMGVIADEICANIIHYAYPGKTDGMLKVGYSFNYANNEAEITFTDSGVPFNPLNVPEPDIENAEERDEGGLGLFLVKKFSDKMIYKYSNDQNILTITKKRNE